MDKIKIDKPFTGYGIHDDADKWEESREINHNDLLSDVKEKDKKGMILYGIESCDC